MRLMSKVTILVVEDDELMLSFLTDRLVEAGYDVHGASSARDALEQIRVHPADVVVTDLVMPGMKGDALLRELRIAAPGVPVILVTGYGTIESAVESMREGAYHYLTKPFRIEQLTAMIEKALEENRLSEELGRLAQSESSSGIVAHSPVMRRTLDLVARAASVDTPVLILGESGTGKELLARALHSASPRKDRAFLALNCSAIPENLIESQLFGHRKGAFTDAREDRRGLFQEAAGGTLMLDEIGDMPLALQAKLLRVLQEREVHALGAPAPEPVDVRVIAATHREIEAMVAEGRFRKDLYYRLNVITIRIPPLRERPEDLVPLVAHFLAHHAPRVGKEGVTLSIEAMELFRRHAWPGNVRELENAIERAMVLGRGPVIRVEDLPDDLRQTLRETPIPHQVRQLAEVEREQILKAMRSVRGNKSAAARLLGLDRKTLYRKLELYDIH
jgi:two-component system response regulator HydG